MPRYPIDRATNFIVEEESWTVVEYDHTSVPGVIYLSLTENKINLIYDDVENNVADLDKLAKYSFIVPEVSPQKFALGDHIDPVFTITKNGVPYLAGAEDAAEKANQLDYIIEDKKIVKNIDGSLIAVKNGQTKITAVIKNDPSVRQELVVQVGTSEEKTPFSLYIEGKNSIRLNREETYIYKSTGDLIPVKYVFTLYAAKSNVYADEEIPLIEPLFKDPKAENVYLTLENTENWVPIEVDLDNPNDEKYLENLNKFIDNEVSRYRLSDLGTTKEKDDGTWVVISNVKNKLGYAILGCTYYINNECKTSYKLIEIIPLW